MESKDKQGALRPGETSIPIPDPIRAGEARKILGVSAAKMSRLLSSGTLPWNPGVLDEREKRVSKEATLKLKGAQAPDRGDRARTERAKAAPPPSTSKADIYLAEWLNFLNLTPQDVARRSSAWAARQQSIPASPLARREEILRTKGVSLPTIRHIVRKQQAPLPITEQRLAAALNITPEQLRQLPPQEPGK
jgi:hypothetical protein